MIFLFLFFGQAQELIASENEPETKKEKEMLQWVNEKREVNEVGQLKWDKSIALVAKSHADEMIEMDYYSHISPVTGTPAQRLKSEEIEFNKMGENISVGRNIKEAFDVLLFSQAHKSNMLDSEFEKIGIGIRKHNIYNWYFVVFLMI